MFKKMGDGIFKELGRMAEFMEKVKKTLKEIGENFR